MVNKSFEMWGRTYYADDIFKAGMINVTLHDFEVGDKFHIKSLIPILYRDGKRNWDVEKMDGTYVLSIIVENRILLFYDVAKDRTFSVPASMIMQDLVEMSGTNIHEYRLEN